MGMATGFEDGSTGGGQVVTGAGLQADRAAFGALLRSTRERRRVTLAQIADDTKIQARHLAALERGDVRSWPGGMYRRAMMRAYAESVGLDSGLALEQFERLFDEDAAPMRPASAVATAPPAPPRPRMWRRAVLLPALGVAILVGVAAAVARFASVGRQPPMASESGTTAQPAAAPVETVGPPPASGAIATSGMGARAGETGALETRSEPTEGQLHVASDPPGSRVIVNGIGWGETPLTIRYLPLEPLRVRVTRPGYASQERVVTLDASRPSARTHFRLAPRP